MLDHRLRLIRRIGHGGMGVVYAAEHVGLGKSVAVKLLDSRQGQKSEVAARLRQEAQHAASIRNEHIVEIFDIGETAQGRTFVVMELLQGESLAQRLQQGPMDEPQICSVARQIAAALQAAHEQGIVHRDIKPENIFLCPRQEGIFVKVLDFGISKALHMDGGDHPRLTQTGMLMGTPLYMSPEQARGDESLDHRIDIYALGVLLYECLTGQVPFTGNNYLKVIGKILAFEVLQPRLLCPERSISAGMEAIVLRAMARDREQRYGSMNDLLADLDLLFTHEPSPPPAGTAPAEQSHLPQRVLTGVGLLMLIGVGAAAWLLWYGATPDREAPRSLAREAPQAPRSIARSEAPGDSRSAARVTAPGDVPRPLPPPAPPVVPTVSTADPLTPAPPAPEPQRAHPHRRPAAPRAPYEIDLLHDEQAPNPFGQSSQNRPHEPAKSGPGPLSK